MFSRVFAVYAGLQDVTPLPIKQDLYQSPELHLYTGDKNIIPRSSSPIPPPIGICKLDSSLRIVTFRLRVASFSSRRVMFFHFCA